MRLVVPRRAATPWWRSLYDASHPAQTMDLTSGSRLGPYEIVSRLGAGGMGEVWSARDTRLDRLVAVKVLPAELAHDAQFRLRFEREARTISQLSHPHICTLYDVGDDFLVMELLEGETLADRIARGPLPMPEVLRLGVQVAQALAQAHRMGVVHRDLKPANVMVTKGGAKLLDFGLARSAEVVSVDGATQHKPLTREGTILGTFQYMAPEQLEGQEADARTDIFALGALLYEMATGRRAFEGKTKTSLIAQIVSAEPKPLRELQPLTPPAFEHVVSRCLSKDPEERWQSAQDIAANLRWAAEADAMPRSTSARRMATMPWAVGGMVLAAATAVVTALLLRAPEPRVVWSDIAAPPDVRLLAPSERGGSALAPDGARIVLTGQDEQGVVRLYLRQLADGQSQPLPGTEGASFPFWSPDSRSIAFFAGGKLSRIDVGQTRSTVIADDVDGRGGAWGPDGTIVFSPSSTSGLSRVRATGGKVEVLTRLTGDQTSHRFPWFLPGGKHLLYIAMADRDRGIHVAPLDGGAGRKLLDAAGSGVFTGGSIVFMRDGALLAQELDLGSLELRGEPRQMAAGVSGRENTFAWSGLSASASGDLLFPAEFTAITSIAWRDRGGALLQTLPSERMLFEPGFDPAEKRVAAASDDPPNSVWEIDLERGRSRRLPFEGGGAAGGATWSRDGKRIVVQTMSGGKPVVAAISTSGGPLEILIAGHTLYPDSFSPDGTVLALSGTRGDGTDFEIFTLTLSDRKVRPFIGGKGNQVRTQFSPDGRFVAYTSDETGRPEVFVQTFPPTGGKWQVTTTGGDQPYWRGDGKELFYLGPDGRMMSIATDLAPDAAFGDPVPLFQTSLVPASVTGNRNQYLVTRDGQRFLLCESATPTPPHLTLVVNFARTLEAGR